MMTSQNMIHDDCSVDINVMKLDLHNAFIGVACISTSNGSF